MLALHKGEILFRQGEEGPLYHLKNGLLKVVRLKEDGTSILVNLLLPGEIFPHHSLISPNKYFGTAIALVTSEIEVIPSEKWYEELKQNPERYSEVALLLQNKLKMMQQRIDQLTAISPSERIKLFKQWAAKTFPNVNIEEVLTQEEIGQFIGIRRETVNRLISKNK